MSDPDFETWEKNQRFTSSKTIFKKAVQLEESYLAEFFNKNQNIGSAATRVSLGYYPEVKAYIDLGTLYTDSLGLLQSNTTNPDLARIVNEQSIVKVGKQLIQYGRDYVKIIEDGNISKVAQLNTTWVSNPNSKISVYPVKRVIGTKLKSSCGSQRALCCPSWRFTLLG